MVTLSTPIPGNPNRLVNCLRIRQALLVALVIVMLAPSIASAQDQQPPLNISLRKDFGFAFGGRYQGSFSMRASGPDDLIEVTYLLDGHVIATAQEPPFRATFNTARYDPGAHELSAIGLTSSGMELQALPRSVYFITAEAAWGQMQGILVPLIGGILLLIVLGTVIPALFRRKTGQTFRPGSYGVAGGAICTRCNMPFTRHFLSPNLLLGKLERCPHCGKWAIVPRASREDLAQAEARITQEATRGAFQQLDQEDHLKRMIDESRFE